MTTSIIFPAFVKEYDGTEGIAISAYNSSFERFLDSAAEILNIDLSAFDFQHNDFLHDELISQYITYIFSCSVADILREQKVQPSFVSGYSMGIYAALYYCGAYSFEGGLLLIKNAWEKITKATEYGKYGMGMVVGLERSDLIALINESTDIEICNQNNEHTFIISGIYHAAERLLVAAKNEGALHTHMLPVSKPYHSRFVEAALTEFTQVVQELTFNVPVYKYVSAMDQRILVTIEDIKKELVENLSSSMNWFKTMNLMSAMGTDVFFECGPSDGLTRNARFIGGDFKSFAVSKLNKFLEVVIK